ncbi:MAG: hypothetical protein ACXITV_04200 [Luteibaculaceae bacterium]
MEQKDNSPSKTRQDDTIEFSEVVNALKQTTQNLKDFFTKSVNLVLKNIVKFFLVAVLAAAAGYGFSYIFSPTFNSKMTVYSAFLSNDDCYNIVDNLGDAIEKSTPERRAEILGIDPTEAKQIKKIRFFNIKEKINPKDSIMVDAPFKIYVEVKNPVVLDNLEYGILSHMRKNELSRRIEFQKRKNASGMVERLEKQIDEIDSLINVIADNLFPREVKGAGGFVYGEPINPVEFFTEAVTLYKDKQAFQDSLDLYFENFQLVDKFIRKDLPDSPKRNNWAILFSLLGCFGFYIKLYNEN